MICPATLKDASVHPRDLTPQLVLAALVVHSILAARGVPLVITSLNDGTHMKGSLHYTGKAFDFRLPSRYTHDEGTDAAVVLALRGSLGADYDVVLEQDHFHVEYDPKENVA